MLNGDAPVRRRAEMEEKYFVYLTAELAPRVLALNGAAKGTRLWCVGIDLGAVHAVNAACAARSSLRGPSAFPASMIWPASGAARRMIWYCAPLPCCIWAEKGIANKLTLAKAEENSLMLCAGQGAYEDDAKADTQALADLLQAEGLPAHLELWGGDVSHECTGGARCWACSCRGFWNSKIAF